MLSKALVTEIMLKDWTDQENAGKSLDEFRAYFEEKHHDIVKECGTALTPKYYDYVHKLVKSTLRAYDIIDGHVMDGIDSNSEQKIKRNYKDIYMALVPFRYMTYSWIKQKIGNIKSYNKLTILLREMNNLNLVKKRDIGKNFYAVRFDDETQSTEPRSEQPS